MFQIADPFYIVRIFFFNDKNNYSGMQMETCMPIPSIRLELFSRFIILFLKSIYYLQHSIVNGIICFDILYWDWFLPKVSWAFIQNTYEKFHNNRRINIK